jgi:glucose-1-phosphate adenylyltransferase
LFEGVDVGRYATIRHAIVEKNVRIPPHAQIGVDLEKDRARGFNVTQGGVVVVPRVDSIEEMLARVA